MDLVYSVLFVLAVFEALFIGKLQKDAESFRRQIAASAVEHKRAISFPQQLAAPVIEYVQSEDRIWDPTERFAVIFKNVSSNTAPQNITSSNGISAGEEAAAYNNATTSFGFLWLGAFILILFLCIIVWAAWHRDMLNSAVIDEYVRSEEVARLRIECFTTIQDVGLSILHEQNSQLHENGKQLRTMTKQLEKKEERLEKKTELLQEVKMLLAKYKKLLKKTKQRLPEQEKQDDQDLRDIYDTHQEDLREKDKKISKLEGIIKSLKDDTQKQSEDDALPPNDRRISDLEKVIQDLLRQQDEHIREIAKLKEKTQDPSKENPEETDEDGFFWKDARISELQSEVDQLDDRLGERQNDLNKYMDDRKQLIKKIDKLEDICEGLDERCKKLQAENEELRRRLSTPTVTASSGDSGNDEEDGKDGDPPSSPSDTSSTPNEGGGDVSEGSPSSEGAMSPTNPSTTGSKTGGAPERSQPSGSYTRQFPLLPKSVRQAQMQQRGAPTAPRAMRESGSSAPSNFGRSSTSDWQSGWQPPTNGASRGPNVRGAGPLRRPSGRPLLKQTNGLPNGPPRPVQHPPQHCPPPQNSLPPTTAPTPPKHGFPVEPGLAKAMRDKQAGQGGGQIGVLR